MYERVFKILDSGVDVRFYVEEGDSVENGRKLATVSGDMRTLLSGERVALNFLQRMSGIATYILVWLMATGAIPRRRQLPFFCTHIVESDCTGPAT